MVIKTFQVTVSPRSILHSCSM